MAFKHEVACLMPQADQRLNTELCLMDASVAINGGPFETLRLGQCSPFLVSNRDVYGNLSWNEMSLGGETRPQPFILPAATEGDVDVETRRAIEHFNAVLCRFYSDTLLPIFYSYTGRVRSFCGEDGPIYVNAKQYHCILRRRIQRAKLMQSNRGTLVRKKYLHESRHRHATKRLRNAHGRFVSKVKIEEGTTDTSSEPSASANSH